LFDLARENESAKYNMMAKKYGEWLPVCLPTCGHLVDDRLQAISSSSPSWVRTCSSLTPSKSPMNCSRGSHPSIRTARGRL
jgi:hypothetical protein